MVRVRYGVITSSLDGYIADETGNFDWAEPDEEVHTFVNDLVRPLGTFLLGRRMYEVLLPWETMDTREQPPYMEDFAGIWKSADKIVYSRTLDRVSSARTRLERDFDPAAVHRLKATAKGDIEIGGPELAGQAINAGLVDEFHLLIAPVVIGGGKRLFPENVHAQLERVEERRFGNGMVYLCYFVVT
jgi:dihydrofolate reductase